MKSYNSFRNFLFALLLFFNADFLFSQIKIGDNPQNLNSTSLLELESTTRVLVVNRMSTSQMELLVPLAGGIVFNTDIGCLHYYDGVAWNNICNTTNNVDGFSITENGDGTYTVDNGIDPSFIFNGGNETITTLVANENNTFTYTNENGVETIINLNSTQTPVSTLEDNGDGTFTYTDEANNQTTLDLNSNPNGVVSTLVDNGDGTFTYTDELGNETNFDLSSGQTPIVSTLANNGDGTFTYTDEANNQTVLDINDTASTLTNNNDGSYTYTDENNSQTTFDLTNTPSTLVDNNDGTFTYTDEAGTITTFFIGNVDGRHFGQPGSVFFANATTGDPTEDNDNLYWDNTNKRLGVGTSIPGTALQVQGIIRSFRVANGTGTSEFPGYHFSQFYNTGMYAPQTNGLGFTVGGSEIMRMNPNQRVGINTITPQATLHVAGDLRVDGVITTPTGTYKQGQTESNTIRRLINRKELINDSDKTLIIESTVKQLVLKAASPENKGTMYILKSLGEEPAGLNISYVSNSGVSTSVIEGKAVTWLQSDGVEWHQIN